MNAQPPDPLPDPDATRTAAAGASSTLGFGSYRLLQRIGEGGMGEVWLAEQTAPVRRQVALKVIKAGMDTAQVVTRFEAERQALALMDHPAIATVFDGGSTPEGRPYFVMEYVKGEPITTYCDRHRLTTQERLELFMQVCEGVQHAHQKGIIHRDLKPSNVLVTIQDDRPVPKIIDFGVAKATARQLTEHTLYTELGVLIGTPEYMSPEQAEMSGLDVDTRTDIYALGVVLYELLTGALPFDRKELRQAGLAEIQRTIREKEPPRPSTRVTQLGPGSAEAATNRHSEPRRLASELRGDLDWVTMRALEKDRTRRYQTATALAADVRHHLSHEPVSAGPPSTVYRARKFVRRHRFGVAAAMTLALLLVAFGVTMAVQAQRIARERDRASREAKVSQQVTAFLTDLFGSSDPALARGRLVTARELLDAGARQIGSTMRDEPELQARLMEVIGGTYDRLGLYAEALPHLEEALRLRRRVLGPEHAETVRAMIALAGLQVRRGQYQTALTMYQQATEIQHRTIGAEHPDRLAAMQDLGWLIVEGGKREEGKKMIQEALEAERRILGNTHSNTLTGIARLANVAMWEGRYADQETLLREEVESRRRVQGRDHPRTLTAERLLAGAIGDQGRLQESETMLRDVLETGRRVLGPGHPGTAVIINDLALTLDMQKRWTEAEPLYKSAIEIYRKTLGPEGDDTLLAMSNLGMVYVYEHRAREAETLYTELLGVSRRVRRPDDPRTLWIMNNLAMAYLEGRKLGPAARLAGEAVAALRRTMGESHPNTLTAVITLSEVTAQQGDAEQALRLIKEAIDHGYRDADQIGSDEYLKPLRGDPRFQVLVAEMRERAQRKK